MTDDGDPRTGQAGEGSPTDAAPRYELKAELDGAGAGALYHAFDSRLQRPVAIRLLRDEHRGDATMVRRFVAAARIGARLQHPGVVPVHDFGLLDGQPFFAQQLVEGRTLADHLTECSDDGDTRAHLLSAFERVCETVAYAHGHGVIHRDLEPHNVLIGAFGEVQVSGWDLGRVLGGDPEESRRDERRFWGQTLSPLERPASKEAPARAEARRATEGAVFGTPAYMPPEQARGEVDALDTRSDVFALGGILCEILTGEPPYPSSPEVALADAAAHQSKDWMRRLDASGDPALARLAAQCLAADPDQRPATAAAVHTRLVAHRETAARRAHRAEVEAERAAARAESARRTVVLTRAFAAVAFALAALGVGAWMWSDSVDRDAVARASTTIEQELVEAATHFGQARAASEFAATTWERGEQALVRARTTAAEVAIPAALDERIRQLAATAEAWRKAAWDADARRTSEARLRESLARITPLHDPIVRSRSQHQSWMDTQFVAAFEEFGVDLESPTAIPRLRGTHVRSEIAIALDRWAASVDSSALSVSAVRLRDLATAIDPDPTRSELRALITKSEPMTARLLKLVDSLDFATVSPATGVLSGIALQSLGEHDRALEVLETTRRAHSAEFDVLVTLAIAQLRHDPPDRAAARRHLESATMLRPGDRTVLQARTRLALADGDAPEAHNLTHQVLHRDPEDPAVIASHAVTLLNLRLSEAAGQEIARGLEGCPDSHLLHYANAARHEARGRFAEAEIAARRAIELAAEHAPSLLILGRLHCRRSEFEEGRALLRRGLAIDPWNAEGHRDLGACRLQTGDPAAGLRSLRRALALGDHSARAHYLLAIAHQRAGNQPAAAEASRAALEQDPDHVGARRVLCRALFAQNDDAAGLAALQDLADRHPDAENVWYEFGTRLFQAKRFRAAVAALEQATKRAPELAQAWCNLGLSLVAAGRAEEAVPALERGHRLGSAQPDWQHPSDRWLADARDRAAREAGLGEVLEGTRPATDPIEAFAAADLALRRGLHAAVDDLFGHAMPEVRDADPALWQRFWNQLIEASERPSSK